ncbi:MAG: prepilin-type N-terminal cleavage/methylation domain-containing protein [Candidatus Gracilibacteria bacterium]
MKKLYRQAFTLVELIVVITILAILGTIAFISFQNYSKSARDGARMADINNIEKSLGIFITEKGFYPIPDYGSHITYSGALARTQGTVGDNVTTNLKNLSKKPVDPLTGDEYTYSVANNNVEYQVATILEGGSMVYNLPLITNQANAATTKTATSRVKGTYNEKILKVNTGGLDYVLAVPSIINSNINHVDFEDIITNKELVYNNYSNIPDSYKNSGYTMTGGFDYNPSSIIVYTGSTYMTGDTEKLEFIDNLKKVYNGTILQGEGGYSEIINTDTATNPTGAVALVDTYITNHIGGITGIVSTTIPTTPPPSSTCSLTQTQVDTLNGLLADGSIVAYGYNIYDIKDIYDLQNMYDYTYGLPSQLTESEWCNDVGAIQGYTLPAEILNLTNLSILVVMSDSITTIPAGIGNLTNLIMFGVMSDSLLTLPPEIGKLTNLFALMIQANSLTTSSFMTLPPEIGNLSNLLMLGVQSNTLPPEIGKLTNLSGLAIISDSLTTLPSEIGKLTNLLMLGVVSNSLTTLPPEIGKLTNLFGLSITSDSLMTLPAEICNLTNLTQLQFVAPLLGNLSGYFGIYSSDVSQIDIPTTGKTMTIGGNETNIVITITP